MALPTTNQAINRVIADPWIELVLNDESVTVATKTFSGSDNKSGAYLGKRKHGDKFTGPASSLTQERFMRPDEFVNKKKAPKKEA